jgi:hypothetical protein
MKVATVVFALLVTCGSAYADPNCNGCKSEDTPPVAGTAAPVPLLSTPPVRTANPCNGSGCKTEDAKPAGQSAVPPAWFPALFGKPGGM